jgi:hypothetical protein
MIKYIVLGIGLLIVAYFFFDPKGWEGEINRYD